ncbi:hypothetical protein [Streptomyces specialis]|uniref:hypothetical protein n=1 Tax=Streptomyces specialis TaxID=498367 RepID=UPI00099EC885|nr:hypothetical protein [Streptomyces specialis]
MRRPIGLALPAIAAAATFLLTGCGDGDSSNNPFAPGGDAGQDGNVPIPGADEGQTSGQDGGDGGEDGALPGAVAGADGGDDGGADGGDDSGLISGAESGGISGGDGGSLPTAGEYDNYWFENVPTDASSLSISSGTVTYVEDAGYEGDVCYGTISGDTITVECNQYGDRLWPDTQATLSLSGSTLTVVWASGTTETYEASY